MFPMLRSCLLRPLAPNLPDDSATRGTQATRPRRRPSRIVLFHSLDLISFSAAQTEGLREARGREADSHCIVATLTSALFSVTPSLGL